MANYYLAQWARFFSNISDEKRKEKQVKEKTSISTLLRQNILVLPELFIVILVLTKTIADSQN